MASFVAKAQGAEGVGGTLKKVQCEEKGFGSS